MSLTAPILEFAGVSTAYGRRTVLRELSLRIQPGERVALIGPNGSGKSTLLHAVFGEGGGRTGAIRIDGRPIEELAPRTRAARIGLLPQESPRSFSFSVEEWVVMGRYHRLSALEAIPEADRRATRAALRRCGLEGMEARNVLTLSGGEWQRVQLARAICQDCGLLLLDEPTTHLDVKVQRELNRVLLADAESSGRALLCVMHDLNFALRLCSRFILLKDGRCLADGPAAEVMTAARLSALFDTPIRAIPARDRPDAPPVLAWDLEPEEAGQ